MTFSNGQANAVNRVILYLAGKPSPSGQELTARGAAADLAFLADSAYRQILCGARTPEAEEAIAAVEQLREHVAEARAAANNLANGFRDVHEELTQLREQGDAARHAFAVEILAAIAAYERPDHDLLCPADVAWEAGFAAATALIGQMGGV